MSDMPERIKVAKCHQFTDPDDLYVCHPKLLHPAAVHYIRADIAQADLDAAVRAAYEDTAKVAEEYAYTISHDTMSDYWAGQGVAAEKIAAAIRVRGK